MHHAMSKIYVSRTDMPLDLFLFQSEPVAHLSCFLHQ